jgi:NADPH:quinone reductase-like Zn-dependent oxidoreductase
LKAALLHQLGTIPKFDTLPDPIPVNDQQTLITVKAAALKTLDKIKASGKHYLTYPSFPTAVGTDGAGILADGTKVYAMGLSGMMAEKALIAKGSGHVIPDGLDFETAAALPNALMGSDAALLFRGKIKKGDVVLINGATGVTGKVAVQMAKYRGASRVIVTGRNADTLFALKALGADDVISLQQTDAEFSQQLLAIQNANAIDIVLDYLWGHPMELILTSLKSAKPHQVKVVTIGEMAGSTINLPSGFLRSSKIEILGSGFGSLSLDELDQYFKNELPKLFALAAEGHLKLDLITYPLKDIEEVWQKDLPAGKRIVIKME